MRHAIKLRRGRRGQALLLVTLSLFAMCGLLGLAVDLGWSYFTKKSAQDAADSAALAVAYRASAGYLNDSATGLLYAQQNGFTPGGNGGRQNVTFTPGSPGAPVTRQDGTTVPACPGPVGCVDYWVTVRTAEAIPQLFSAVLGNLTGLSSARATAAIVEARVNGSLITLNRANDSQGPNPAGVDVTPSPITATSGLIASGSIQSGSVIGPIIALTSVANPGTGSSFQNMVDGPQFLDPMRGYGQPPLPTSALPTYAVIGGNMSGSTGGVYQFIGNSNAVNTTQPIAVGGTATLPSGNYVPGLFGPGCIMGGTCLVDPGAPQLNLSNTVTFNAAPFGYYFFYGGLNVAAGGKMIMGPGEYVFVGGQGGGALTTAATAAMDGGGSPGAVIILTGASGPFTINVNTNTATGPADLYPGLLTQINSNNFTVTMAGISTIPLAFAPTTLLAPLDQTAVTSLDPTNSALPTSLVPFGGIVLWQDQANSGILYTTLATPPPSPGPGYVDIFSCGSGNMANPCTKALLNQYSPGISVQTQYAMGFNGTIYQPRGAWINVGPGTLGGQMQVITGSVAGNPGSAMFLTPPTIPLRRRIVALIE